MLRASLSFLKKKKWLDLRSIKNVVSKWYKGERCTGKRNIQELNFRKQMLLMEMASIISYFWVTVKYVGTPQERRLPRWP